MLCIVAALVAVAPFGILWPAAQARTSSPALSLTGPVIAKAGRPAIDLRLVRPSCAALDPSKRPIGFKSLIRAVPVEVTSQKVVGASGFGVFVRLNDFMSVGEGVTSFNIEPHERVLQGLVIVRFKL